MIEQIVDITCAESRRIDASTYDFFSLGELLVVNLTYRLQVTSSPVARMPSR